MESWRIHLLQRNDIIFRVQQIQSCRTRLFVQRRNELCQYQLLIEHLEDYYEDFDANYETYIWLDQWGHGKNGAPYSLRAVLEDSESIEKMVEVLLKAIKKMEVPEEYWNHYPKK